MPAKSVIQVRRDTAANWSSTNPILANGEMGYDTTNKLFKVGDGATAWNSLKVMAQQNTGSAAAPLLTGGAYLDGSTGLVLSGLASNNASAPDSAALSITGDIDIKVKVNATDWTPASDLNLIAKYGAAGQRAFVLNLRTTGVLRFEWSADGTNVTTVSSVATGITDGTAKWVRFTMDVDNGSSQKVIKFYTSDDATTWTQLGTTTTTAGATSLFDSTAVLDIGGGTNVGGWFIGTISRVIIQSAYDTADNTTSLAFDANFATQTADALAFTESSSNAATVTVNTTRYTVGYPNTPYTAVVLPGATANLDYWHWFNVTSASIVDAVFFEVTTTPASNSTIHIGLYAADANFNPTGTPIINFGPITVNNGQTGVFVKQVTPVTLQPGAYVLGFNNSVSTTYRGMRALNTFLVSSLGASAMIRYFYNSRTNATFPNTPPVPNQVTNSTVSNEQFCFLRWKAA